VLAGVLTALISAPAIGAGAESCRVTVHGDVAFGTYDVFSVTARHATMRIRLDCPRSAAPQIAISRGNSPTFGARELRSGRDVLRYNLFVDPGHRVVWGDGTDGSRMPAVASGNAEVTVYARMSPGQDVAPGTYTDTLVVTVFL
jgi:spore coat protein U-like protein